MNCAEDATLYCDRTHTREALNNLLINAAEAMEHRGETVVTFEQDDKKKLKKIRVQDSGGGITEENRRKLFTPYFTTKQKGFGLGLAYSANVMRSHGGFIDVHSQPGEGSVFTLCFPS